MLVDCLMQVYRIGFLVTSLPVNCNNKSLHARGQEKELDCLKQMYYHTRIELNHDSVTRMAVKAKGTGAYA